MTTTTTRLLDVRRLTMEQREAMAARVQVAADFQLPKLRYWNDAPCRKHRRWEETFFDQAGEAFTTRVVTDRPKPGCRDCGIVFRRHQRVGIGWAYLKGRCLNADTVGSGKTAQALGLVALLKETGELPEDGRVLIVPRPAALYQWYREAQRLIPAIPTLMVDGLTKAKRIERYAEPWDVLLLGPQILHNDYELLVSHFRFTLLISDDVDALRNRDTQTAVTLKRVGRASERMIIFTGTPLQKRLQEMHSILDPIGGLEAFGSERAFLARYTRQNPVKIYNPKAGRSFTKVETVGYKNISEFVEKMSPMVLRRTAKDIEDVNLPVIMPPNDIYLDLYPAQRAKYAELQKGIIQMIRNNGQNPITHVHASTSVHTAGMICGGLSVLGEEDGPGTSVKLDWVERTLVDGDLSDEKVVVFIRYKNGVRSLQVRLQRAGVGFETIWGEDRDKSSRAAAQERFWSDDKCRVMIGTQAIEQSLNFQCARHLINFDLLPNPARMEQLVGRIRRDGSAHPHVYVHNLLTTDTHESRLLAKLEVEQALIDRVWDEKSDLFAGLTPLQMMQLIADR